MPFPSPEFLPDPGTEAASPRSPALQVPSLPLSDRESPLLGYRRTTLSGCFPDTRGASQVVHSCLPVQQMQFRSLGWEDSLEEGMTTTAVFLPGESHGQRSLIGYSPQGCKESDTAEATWHACMSPQKEPAPRWTYQGGQKDEVSKQQSMGSRWVMWTPSQRSPPHQIQVPRRTPILTPGQHLSQGLLAGGTTC